MGFATGTGAVPHSEERGDGLTDSRGHVTTVTGPLSRPSRPTPEGSASCPRRELLVGLLADRLHEHPVQTGSQRTADHRHRPPEP